MTTDYRLQLLESRNAAGRSPSESSQMLDAITAGVHPALFPVILPALGFTDKQAAFGYGIDTAMRRINAVLIAFPVGATLERAEDGGYYINAAVTTTEPADVGYIDPADPLSTWGSVTPTSGAEPGPHSLFSDPETVAAWIISEAMSHDLSRE